MAQERKIVVEENALEKTADTKRVLADDVNGKLVALKNALNQNNLALYSEGMVALNKSLEEYNKFLQIEVFEELKNTDAPVINAVKRFYYNILAPKEKFGEQTKEVVDVELVEKQRRIDLEAFCKYAELSTKWADDACKLRNMLESREVDVYSMKPSDLAKKSYYFISLMKKKAEGETPDSNTQIVKLLQEIIDDAIFVDNGNGKNRYKCNNHDIAFIQDAVTKFDPKKKCSIAMMKEKAFKTVMMSVFAHCLGEDITITSGARKSRA